MRSINALTSAHSSNLLAALLGRSRGLVLFHLMTLFFVALHTTTEETDVGVAKTQDLAETSFQRLRWRPHAG